MNPYGYLRLEHASDLIQLSKELSLFVFRGQASSDWELVSSLERAYQQSGNNIYTLENDEYWMIHDFSSKYHLYSPSSPTVKNKFEWLALLQHHGGATRLLDFTKSIYVAAYFATLDSKSDAAIWAINRPLLRDNLFKTGKLTYRPGHDLKDVVNTHHVALFDKNIARLRETQRSESLIHLVPLESQSLFDRASRQQSLFIAAGYLGDVGDHCSYMENLFSSFDGLKEAYEAPHQLTLEDLNTSQSWTPNYEKFGVVKIVIPCKIHRDIKRELSMMGLSDETLFPGLDGLSRSITNAYI